MASLSSCLQEDKNGRPEVAVELVVVKELAAVPVLVYMRQGRRYCGTGVRDKESFEGQSDGPLAIGSFLTFSGSLLLLGLLENRRQCFKSP